MKLVPMIGSLLIASGLVAAQPSWTAKIARDAMTDEATPVAITTAAGGQSLALLRRKDGTAWLIFSLPDGSPRILARDKPPVYRVDKLPPHDLRLYEILSATKSGRLYPTYMRKPSSVSFQLWDGTENGQLSSVAELLQGQRLLWRSYFLTEGSEDVEFSLDGAGQAIAEVLELDKRGGQAWVLDRRDFYKLRSELRAACVTNATEQAPYLPCQAQVDACLAQTSSAAAALQACR